MIINSWDNPNTEALWFVQAQWLSLNKYFDSGTRSLNLHKL